MTQEEEKKLKQVMQRFFKEIESPVSLKERNYFCQLIEQLDLSETALPEGEKQINEIILDLTQSNDKYFAEMSVKNIMLLKCIFR